MSAELEPVLVRVHAPSATAVTLATFDDSGAEIGERVALSREGDDWVGSVAAGTLYGLMATGDGRRFDASKVLLDPFAAEAMFPQGFRRAAARVVGRSNVGESPLGVARHRCPATAPRPSENAPVVYELHVRGLTIADESSSAPGTFRGVIGQLDRLAALGISVIELMPVHQSDPHEGSYWGYMPLLFGAVEPRLGAGDDAAAELTELVEAAHERGIEVWVDVVFNHTTEVDAAGPTYHLRGLADDDFYVVTERGDYVETTGCGNDVNVAHPATQRLIVSALDRLADLGIDGFRFDLAPVVVRDRGFAAELDRWAAGRSVRMIAEPWDAAGDYLLGRAFPGAGWAQWNDRYRDDVRGFLRGEPGLVPLLQQRVQASPDLFDAPLHSVNFLSCHDGFALYDVFAYDTKHNEANGQHNRDGSHENRSWNCGWEGDVGVPADVMELRRRQLRNAWTLLAMSHGIPMVAMGDEFGRTQGGNNNAYNQDNATSWVDWDRRAEFADLESFVGAVLAVRGRHRVLAQKEWWGDAVSWFGSDGAADLSLESRSLAWCVGDLYVIANAWWEPLTFDIQAEGPWQLAVDTSSGVHPNAMRDARRMTGHLASREIVGSTYEVGPRSVVVFERSPT